jgi:uncharacterized membrane protein YfcA
MWFLVLMLGVVAGTIGCIIGFGSSIVLLPALVMTVGPKEAVPILAIAGLMANLSRAGVWWREVDWRANTAYCVTAIPAAALGARTLVALEGRLVACLLGLFFLVMIPIRRWLLGRGLKIALWQLSLVGAAVGYLSGILATVGPINTPFFLAYGLVKGAYLSTEALGSAAVGITKAVVFRRFDALPAETIVWGLCIGSSVMAGSWLAKRFVLRLGPDHFRYLMDGLMAVAGLVMLWSAFGPSSGEVAGL